MDKKQLGIITLFLIILIFGIGAYLSSLSKTPIKNNTEKVMNEKEKFLLKRYEYPKLDNFFAILKKKEFGIERIEEIVKNKENKSIKINYGWFEIEGYYKENEKIYCIKLFEKEKKCALVEKDEEFGELAERLKTEIELIELGSSRDEKEFIEYLIKNNILIVLDNITDKTIAENFCKMLKYEVDYEKLTQANLEEMQKKNISFQTFGVGYIKRLEQEDCFDDKNGISLYKNMSYEDIFGGSGEYFFEIIKLKISQTEPQLMIPKINAELTTLKEIKNKIEGIQQGLDSCLKKADNKTKCYFISAIDNREPDICTLIEDGQGSKEECYYQYAIRTNSIEFCTKTGQKKDFCYIDYVALNKEKDLKNYCNMIENESLKLECLKLYQSNRTT